MAKTKTLLAVVLLVAVVGLGFYLFEKQTKQGEENIAVVPEATNSFQPLNASYEIEGQVVALVNGKAEQEIAPISITKIFTSVWADPVLGDLNNDGADDAALILTQDSGGSGTFFYVAVALNEAGKPKGINTILLGDRIAPQNISIKDGVIRVDYAVRNPDEPMVQAPSVGVSEYYKVVGNILQESQ